VHRLFAWEGFLLNRQTKVSDIKVRSRAVRLEKTVITRPTEYNPKKTWGNMLLQLDKLGRNLAVVGGLFLVVLAVRNSTIPEAQSVFGAIQASAQMEWDESLGKLTFVNSILPENIRAVWQENPVAEVFAPVNGKVVHAWSRQEPYLMIETKLNHVRAASDGEIMSVAHGLNEEKIIRLRHNDGNETLYGNLLECYIETGDRVAAGELLGTLLKDQPLAFELRVDGRSVDPSGQMRPFEE